MGIGRSKRGPDWHHFSRDLDPCPSSHAVLTQFSGGKSPCLEAPSLIQRHAAGVIQIVDRQSQVLLDADSLAFEFRDFQFDQ